MKEKILLLSLLIELAYGVQAFAHNPRPNQQEKGKEKVSQALASARKTCVSCNTDHSTVTNPATLKETPNTSPQKIVACANGHTTDVECIADSLKAQSHILGIEQKGLPCVGDGCKSTLAMGSFINLLEPEDREGLVARLEKAKAMTAAEKARDIDKLRDGLESAFNRCCPIDGCGSTFDQMEGCNAGTCSNEECGEKFCYLCMKPQKDNKAAHVHARGHSGNYWENRPGYAERYEWLLARKKLAHLFRGKTPENIRFEALESHRALLSERNMWPMPAGLTADQWIQQLETSGLSLDNKIEMLQNEYIFRSRKEDRKNASRVEAELRRHGAKVLASLDVRDADGIPAPLSAAIAVASVPAAAAAPAGAAPHQVITPVLEGDEDPRIDALSVLLKGYPDFFRYGGNEGRLYVIQDPRNQVQPFVLSDTVGHADHYHAADLCPVGTRLPTRQELEALSRAMSPGGRYSRNLIPGISGNDVWSSLVYEGDRAYSFSGTFGYVHHDMRTDIKSVRCVWELPVW